MHVYRETKQAEKEKTFFENIWDDQKLKDVLYVLFVHCIVHSTCGLFYLSCRGPDGIMDDIYYFLHVSKATNMASIAEKGLFASRGVWWANSRGQKVWCLKVTKEMCMSELLSSASAFMRYDFRVDRDVFCIQLCFFLTAHITTTFTTWDSNRRFCCAH